MQRAARVATVATALLFGCGGTPASMSSPLDVTLAMYSAQAMTLTVVNEGDAVDLVYPPQGGFVMFVGAQVRGLDANVADVALKGRLLDAAGTTALASDMRTVTMQPSASDPTTYVPDLRSYVDVANVTVCPSYFPFDLFGQPYTLEIAVTELSTMRTGVSRHGVVPSCRQTDAAMQNKCMCECAANYHIGKCPL
jgi:hypothetical protein